MPANPGHGDLTTSFGDRLADRVATRRSQIVLGLDPDPARLWPEAIRRADIAGAADAPAATRAARAVAAHCALAIEATADECVAVKPQVACFERLGAAGWSALAETVAVAREHGLIVIADAKRGDVDVTAAAYAQAFLGETPSPFGPIEGLGADAMTVNPLLGRDSLEPFVATARTHGRGLFVLVRTSNPGAADVQERPLADGTAVSEHLAGLVADIGGSRRRPQRLVRHRRGRWRHRTRPAGGAARAHAARGIPAARRRCPGRKRRGPRAGVRERAGRRIDLGLARDRRGARARRRRPGWRRDPRGPAPARARLAPGGVSQVVRP